MSELIQVDQDQEPAEDQGEGDRCDACPHFPVCKIHGAFSKFIVETYGEKETDQVGYT